MLPMLPLMPSRRIQEWHSESSSHPLRVARPNHCAQAAKTCNGPLKSHCCLAPGERCRLNSDVVSNTRCMREAGLKRPRCLGLEPDAPLQQYYCRLAEGDTKAFTHEVRGSGCVQLLLWASQ